MIRLPLSLALLTAGWLCAEVYAHELVLDERLHHRRAGKEREWSEFPDTSNGPRLQIGFKASRNDSEHTLRWRQQDVKQPWTISLNGKSLGRLRTEEDDTVVFLPVPSGVLVDGENTLVIESPSRVSDDIRVGELGLYDRPARAVLSEATLRITVRDATGAGQPVATPCRITVLNADGALMTTSAASNETLAVRPGIIYTGDGRDEFGLPAGDYAIYAGRGFEYGIAAVKVSLKPGAMVRKELLIRREVDTKGYVSCDTHVHSLTYSGHGDATIAERVLAIAGEGLELPIATEHNRHVDYDSAARRHGVRAYFTPVVGNEVTTPVGHFNIFPVHPDGSIPEFEKTDGHAILDGIAERTGAKVIVLNHARDLHRGFRPFGPERHNAVTGENRDTWLLRPGGMEVVNSGAQQTDIMQLFHDWFGLLNRGVFMTPIGASDSHDVGRYIVGQARTYIHVADERPDAIDVDEAMSSLLACRVLVSCGLFVEMTVNDTYGPGDMVPRTDEVQAIVRVSGPRWTSAEQVALYANGAKICEAKIWDRKAPGLKWTGVWTLPKFEHDVHLVAIATGPGVKKLYWPIAKPYQPTAPDVRPTVIGSTGAIWLDADGDGRRTTALEYAERLISKHGNEAAGMIPKLADYDEAVAAQAASLLHARGISADDPGVIAAAREAGPHVERGFRAFFAAWREGEIARSERR